VRQVKRAFDVSKRNGERMTRKPVPEHDLRKWLDTRIQKHDECADCRFGGIIPLRGTDDSGCNWSAPLLRCSGQPAENCLPIAIRVLAEAREKFNLVDSMASMHPGPPVFRCTPASQSKPKQVSIIGGGNPVILNIFIDSCAFDPKYEPETSASNEIFRLSEQGHFILVIAHSTQKELEHPNTPDWAKQRASVLIYSIDVELAPNEKLLLQDVQRILAGNGKVENVRQDARHVFEAQKYGGYFVTTDKRILSRVGELKKCCGVLVLLPSEFMALLKQHTIVNR